MCLCLPFRQLIQHREECRISGIPRHPKLVLTTTMRAGTPRVSGMPGISGSF
jgi:hypothetical protein